LRTKQEQPSGGLLVALAGLPLLDPQVAQQPVERLLVGVVVLAAGISDEAPLAAPRKGWLERVLEALRRR
jgi:hypothetical protein